ncbi:MAG: protease inhibitor I42 family protein [Planctomycetaceae bacterium]
MNARGRIFSAAAGVIGVFSAMVFFSGQSEVWAMGKEQEVILQKQDNGKELKLKVGQVFQIRLQATGGTGYWWYVQPLDPRYVESLGEKTQVQAEGRVGGPVLGIWSFQAKGAGTTEIKMDYYRKWEGAGKAIEKFRVKITIE